MLESRAVLFDVLHLCFYCSFVSKNTRVSIVAPKAAAHGLTGGFACIDMFYFRMKMFGNPLNIHGYSRHPPLYCNRVTALLYVSNALRVQ